jgi:predicted nuclease with TOPRIM domain
LTNLFGLYEKLDKRIERLEHEYLAITVALKRLDQNYERLEADRLAQRVQLLEQRVAALEKGPPN